jgi:EAL domain-containing protein (putative c-di-GMP-specific phosphodiesterase class I)
MALKLVAEGVETAEQLAYLADRRGTAPIAVQGFFFSRPRTVEEMGAFLTGQE